MRRQALVLICVLVVAVTAWLWAGSDARKPAGPVPPAVEDLDAGGGSVALAPAAEASPRSVPSEGLATEPAVEPEAPAGEPTVELRLVRGLLLDAGSLAPLPGYRLDLLARLGRGVDPIEVTTDEAGRFEVEARVGEYLVLHRAAAGTGDDALACAIEPAEVELEHAEGGLPFDVTLHARRPPQVLDVEVVYEDGAPGAGVWALFSCLIEDEPFVDTRAKTDERGRARLGVWDPAGLRHGHVRAWDDVGNTSTFVPVEAPFVPGIRRLVLAPGAQVEIAVSDTEGHPVVKRRVLLASALPVGPRLYEETDEAGRHVFEGVFPGTYSVAVWEGSAGHFTSEKLELASGDRRKVEVVVEEGEKNPAVSGRVVDEEGRPLANVDLVVYPDGSFQRELRSDADGAFACFADPCEGLEVRTNLSAEGDVFEPDSVRVAYGTEDVLFTRTRTAETRRFEVEVVDAVTGLEVPHFTATIDRGPGTEEWSNTYAPRRAFELRVLPETRWRVAARGYVARELQLARALDALEPGERLRVALDPGLSCAFRVLDADTGEPIEGVSFSSETGGTVRSDAEGRVRMESDHWSVYRVEKPGYQEDTWDPEDYVLWQWGPFLLAPEEDGGDGG